MSLLKIVDITLFKFDFGPKVDAVLKLGWGQGEPSRDQIEQLAVPWKPNPEGELFSLLSWHSRLSTFAGRDNEMNQLRKWATGNRSVRVKFVIGEGGVGKSRLGAEFAEEMQKKKWAAGFVNLKKPQAYQMKKEGTLLVIDYPEEHINRVRELLDDLTKHRPDVRIRVLFLTRQPPENWDEIISSANARDIVDRQFTTLGRLDVKSSKIVYDSTVRAAGEKLQRVSSAGLGPAPIPEEAMAAWLKLAPENERALFIMAAAVHSAENPEREVVDYSGREVVKALVEREVGRYQRMAEGRLHIFKDKFALARLLAMAAIADELSIVDIKRISQSDLPVGFTSGADIEGELMTAGLLIDGKVRAPKPDIVAAAFTVDVLGRRAEHAPEIVWAALKDDIGSGLERIGRLCYDAEIVLGIHEPCLSKWLAQAVDGNLERSSELDGYFIDATMPQGWVRTAIAAWKTLLKHAGSDIDRSRYTNNLSVVLAAIGDRAGALAAIQEAVAIRRRLAESNPARFEPDLAQSLNNLSNRLSDTGDREGALAAIQEAAELYHRLAKANPARFEPDLATSLNNLSIRLSDTGDTAGALAAIQEAVAIRRRLAEASPAQFEPYLAQSLNNLSLHLSDTGDTAGALAAIQEATEFYRRLAEANPARYEPDLALSLNNLSSGLSATGNTAGALAAIQEAVEIYRRLAEATPARFEPDLALSLNNLSTCLSDTGDAAGALAAIQEAVEIYRRLAEATPARFEPDLAASLNNLSNRLSDTGDRAGALAAIQEAVAIRRRLAEANPARFEPDLATSLRNLGLRLRDMGKSSEAADIFKQAMALIRPYAEKWPGSSHEKRLKDLEEDLKRSSG
jgi:hypothetical protein